METLDFIHWQTAKALQKENGILRKELKRYTPRRIEHIADIPIGIPVYLKSRHCDRLIKTKIYDIRVLPYIDSYFIFTDFGKLSLAKWDVYITNPKEVTP